MSAETINESINVCKCLGAEKMMRTIEGDIVLPDIKPDILSIVKVKGRLCINQIKPEDNKVVVDGKICFNIIYISDDNMNSQKGITHELDFSETISFPRVNSNSIIRLRYDVGNVEYKVLNNRKITVKVPVLLCIKAFNNCEINIVKGIANDDNIEVQKNIKTMCSKITVGNTRIDIKENVQLDNNNSPIGEILDCDLSIINKDYKLSYNKILAKADARVKIIYSADNEDQSIEKFETTIPLMGIIDVDNLNDLQKVKLDYTLNNFCVKPVYQDLQANCISVEICTNVDAYVYEKNELDLITDFYTPNAILKSEYESNSVLCNLIDAEENIELSQTLVVPELDNTRILNISGNVNINEKNVLKGKIAVTGNVEVFVLYLKSTNNLIENKKIDLPFQHVIKIENISPNMETLLNVEIDDINYSTVGENQLQITIKMIASVLADEEDSINSISKIEISDENVPIMPSMVVYYVKPGDSLWSIAKKFRNKIEYIKEFNELSDDVITPGQRLLIPRLVSDESYHFIM